MCTYMLPSFFSWLAGTYIYLEVSNSEYSVRPDRSINYSATFLEVGYFVIRFCLTRQILYMYNLKIVIITLCL